MSNISDAQVGRLVDGIDQLGLRDNTIIFYIFGDNGSSAEGQNGTISELLAQNMIPNTIEQQLAALDKIGGLDALGTNKVENMYHAGWAWAGDTPFRYTKLIASHFGGTRNPLVISWPKGIKPDKTPRAQFHHVNDIAPTIYEILGIKPPEVVNGEKQDPIDGVSMVYSFADAAAPGRKPIQYFENNGSRAIYHDGWIAAAFGPLTPWLTVSPRARDLGRQQGCVGALQSQTDFSEADDLAAAHPDKLDELKELFKEVSRDNLVWPVGAGLWLRIHPEDRISSPYTSGDSTILHPDARIHRPGSGPPGQPRRDHTAVPDNASGVLYALGGFSGGLTLFMDASFLVYGYNMLIIDRFQARSAAPIPPGEHVITVDTRFDSPAADGAGHGDAAGRRRPGRRCRGGAHRTRRVHRQRNLRRRSRSRLPGVTGLLRPTPVPLHRHHRPRHRRSVPARQGRLTWGHCGPAWLRSSSPAR